MKNPIYKLQLNNNLLQAKNFTKLHLEQARKIKLKVILYL